MVPPLPRTLAMGSHECLINLHLISRPADLGVCSIMPPFAQNHIDDIEAAQKVHYMKIDGTCICICIAQAYCHIPHHTNDGRKIIAWQPSLSFTWLDVEPALKRRTHRDHIQL